MPLSPGSKIGSGSGFGASVGLGAVAGALVDSLGLAEGDGEGSDDDAAFAGVVGSITSVNVSTPYAAPVATATTAMAVSTPTAAARRLPITHSCPRPGVHLVSSKDVWDPLRLH